MERHLEKRLRWRSWGNKTRHKGDAPARNRWSEREIFSSIWPFLCRQRKKRQKTARVQAPQEIHFEARTWRARLGSFTNAVLKVCFCKSPWRFQGGENERNSRKGDNVEFGVYPTKRELHLTIEVYFIKKVPSVANPESNRMASLTPGV